MSIVATRLEKGQEIRWTVTVTGRSARGLARDRTCYRPEEIREEAEQAAIEEAIRRWPASTRAILVSSYESGHTTHIGEHWKEVCRYRQRDLETPCPDHPDYHLDGRGWCWFGDHYPGKERDMRDMRAVESPSSEAVGTPTAAPYEELPECYGNPTPEVESQCDTCAYLTPCMACVADTETSDD